MGKGGTGIFLGCSPDSGSMTKIATDTSGTGLER